VNFFPKASAVQIRGRTTYLLALLAVVAAARVNLVLPATNALDLASATVSIVGAGEDGLTTYVAIPPARATIQREFSLDVPRNTNA
jgi:hypothetical protein